MAITEKFKMEARTPGKGNSKTLRKQHKIPAVVYGPNTKNQNVMIEELFVVKHSGSRHESSIFEAQSDQPDLNSLKVILKKIQTHPSTGRPIHVDLYALDMTASIRVNVTIRFLGEPLGVKEDGGIRQITLGQIEVECNPNEIPQEIQVDISHLRVGNSIHVSEMTFPPGVKPITSGDRTIITINHPREEKVEPTETESEETPTETTAETKKATQTPSKQPENKK